MRSSRQDLENQRQQLFEEFKLLYPELQNLSPEKELEAMERLAKEAEQKSQKSLKEHMEVFSDAVIAVIITVMLLEIPLPEHSGNLHPFLSGILIFLVSFFIVADFWYDNHQIHQKIDHTTPKILIMQFIFMASLALLPIFTRWMMEGITTPAVVGYAIVALATNLWQSSLNYLVNKEKFAQTTYTKAFITRISSAHIVRHLLGYLAIMGLAFIQPQVAFYVFILRPIASFLTSAFPKRSRVQERQFFTRLK